MSNRPKLQKARISNREMARDTYGDIPKKNGVDVVNAAIGMAMNNQRPKDWAMQ